MLKVPINPINILVCIIYAQKIKRTHSFCQSASLGLAGNTQRSLWSSSHALCAAILWLGSCLYKIVYSILFSLKHWGNLKKKGNLKLIQSGGDDTQVKKCKTKSWKTNTTIWTSSKRRLTVHLSSHTTISGPHTQKLTSQNRHYLCWISATHLNHNFTLSYHLLLTQNNLQFSSDNFLYIYLTPDTLFVKRIRQVNKKV